ncbi:MAG TPA: hypothetical protein PKB04_07515, partial [Phenylobacterium sp.]|nr:hypothetical protein [Phenylobacterium sp.]
MRLSLLTTAALLPLLAPVCALGDDAATPVSELVVIGAEGPTDFPGAATRLEAEVFERSLPNDINDVLRRVPGLFVRSQ